MIDGAKFSMLPFVTTTVILSKCIKNTQKLSKNSRNRRFYIPKQQNQAREQRKRVNYRNCRQNWTNVTFYISVSYTSTHCAYVLATMSMIQDAQVFHGGEKFCVSAYITFENEPERNNCLREYYRRSFKYCCRDNPRFVYITTLCVLFS